MKLSPHSASPPFSLLIFPCLNNKVFDFNNTKRATKEVPMSPLMSPQDGMTALMYAARYGKTATATLLIERGADIGAKDKVRIRL